MKLNQSVQRAIGILRVAASQPGGETASGLARGAGLPWATAVRLIRTLEEEGFLYRLRDTERYVPGLELVRLGRSGDYGRLFAATALTTLERLSQDVGETVFLTVVHPDGRLEAVEQVEIPRFIRTTDFGGSPYPLHATASGKLLLSTYDEAGLEEYVSGGLPSYTPATITDPAVLREEVARVRASGLSSIVDELEEGLAAISAGVRNPDGQLVAIITVSGPSFRFDEAARREALHPLQDAAETVARIVAGTPKAVGAPSQPVPAGSEPTR